MNDGSVVERIVELGRKLRSDNVLQKALDDAFDTVGFTDGVAAANGASRRRKTIKDNVWGMLEPEADEVLLIDSPLLQRLRGIRQLGFSNLVYPSAEHSRFAHTLGMSHVASRLVAAIDRAATDGFVNLDELAPLDRREIVYAALLHGIGNLPLSRAAEAALAGRPELFTLGGVGLEDRLTRVNAVLGRNVPFSVALSVLIVLSRRFAAFYARLDPGRPLGHTSLARVAGMVAGAPISDVCPNIQDLVSSAAMDANKIDYLNRDAQACGIAIGVDTSRIFTGGALVRARRSTYDTTYEGEEEKVLYVVNASGSDTLAEIAHARAAMYRRVYLHPLTRAAEALLARGLVLNAGSKQSEADLTDVLTLWCMGDDELLRRFRLHDDPVIAGIGSDLAMRRLPKKACAFSASLVTLQLPLAEQFGRERASAEASLLKDVGGPFLEELKGDSNGVDVQELEADIRAEAIVLADLLRPVTGELVPDGDPGRIVVTRIAAVETGRPDAMILRDGRVLRVKDSRATGVSEDAYDVFRSVGYVMCDPPWRQIVFQAARSVIYRKSSAFDGGADHPTLAPGSEVSFRRHTLLDFDGAALRSNLSLDDTHDLAAAASGAGYYQRNPVLARREKASHGDVQAVAARFRAFDGEGGWKVTPATVAAFADQFPPHLRQPLLDALVVGTQLNQDQTSRFLSKGLKTAEAAGLSGATLVPLSSSSGGSSLAMLKPHLGTGGAIAETTLATALSDTTGPIILVDDNAASGTQSVAQLHAYSGGDRNSWPPDLVQEDGLFPALGPAEWELLKKRSWGVVVAIGAPTAGVRLAEEATRLGLTGFAGLHVGETLGAAVEWTAELREFLEAVGRDLVAHRRCGVPYAELPDGLDRDVCNLHCFGYGSYGGVTVTNANVPASTVTALWHPGLRDGMPWVPLFIRRGRLGELILG